MGQVGLQDVQLQPLIDSMKKLGGTSKTLPCESPKKKKGVGRKDNVGALQDFKTGPGKGQGETQKKQGSQQKIFRVELGGKANLSIVKAIENNKLLDGTEIKMGRTPRVCFGGGGLKTGDRPTKKVSKGSYQVSVAWSEKKWRVEGVAKGKGNGPQRKTKSTSFFQPPVLGRKGLERKKHLGNTMPLRRTC